MAKISDILIGMILLCLIIGGFMYFLTELNNYYEPTNFNETNTTLAKYKDRTSELNNISNEIRSRTINTTEQSGALDVIGSFFRQGYSVVKYSAVSADLTSKIAQDAITDAPDMGAFKENLRMGLIAIIIIIIFLAVIVRALINRDI